MEVTVSQKALRQQTGKKRLISRFAPSPSGFLHLGHIVSAMYVWGISRALNAKIVLRIEDHDRQRSHSKYTQAILRDLGWLGFIDHEKDLEISLSHHDRGESYKKHLRIIEKQNLSYYCHCTRKSLREKHLPQSQGKELKYLGNCREAGLTYSNNVSTRLKAKDEVICFWDYFRGTVCNSPYNVCGDFILRDRKQNWSYQFASVVDDITSGVNLVIRGEDLLSSTSRQLLLHDIFSNREPTHYIHHPLVISKKNGIKLSKTHAATSIGSMREKGVSPMDVLAKAAKAAHFTCGEKVRQSQIKDIVTKP